MPKKPGRTPQTNRDPQFQDFVDRLLQAPKAQDRSVTLRMSEDLLGRLQALAKAHKIPYQRLMKRMLEESVAALERRG